MLVVLFRRMPGRNMKLSIIIFTILFLTELRFWFLVVAELQGPEISSQSNVKQLPTEKANHHQQQQSENFNNENGVNDASSNVAATVATSSDASPENGRKTAKSINDQELKETNTVMQSSASILQAELGNTGKLLQTALFERLWNDKLIKQQLQEQINEIEARRVTPDIVDPTPEQIEAHSMYEKAMNVLAKPNSDKRTAYTLIVKAAKMGHNKSRAELAWAGLLGHYTEFNFHQAATEFDELANEGLPEAHMGLAFLHSVGVGGKNVSQSLAIIHFTLAALGDNIPAQMALGYRYLYGINVPTNCEKSLIYYKKVAKTVASKVTFSNGPLLHRVRLLDELENPGSQETEIVEYYQLLADKGDVQSQVGLGQLYYQGGKAIQPDHQKALEYFTQAANADNSIALAFLGKLYLEGSEHIKADNETAFKYFSKAAELGDPVGQSGLGLMYLKGLGVPKDTLKALKYFNMASDQGWVDGQLQLAKMYFTGNGVKTDYKLASKYFQLASQAGHILAYYNLGIMNAYGMGTLRSCPTAVELFKNVAERGRWSTNLMRAYNDYKNSRIDKAFMQYALLAEMGYEVAQSNSAFLLDRGDVTIFNDRHEDLIRAFYYWKRAAGQGYSAAQVKLGDYYYYGLGTEIDFETAAALYRKASDQQYNAQAMFNLGYMHEKGLGMKKDWHLAKRLYDLAAETNPDAKIPVAIALLKLQILSKIEAIKESPYRFIFYLDESIAANWDLYLITVVTLLLGFITYVRRTYERETVHLQNEVNQIQNEVDHIQNEVNNPTTATVTTPTTTTSAAVNLSTIITRITATPTTTTNIVETNSVRTSTMSSVTPLVQQGIQNNLDKETGTTKPATTDSTLITNSNINQTTLTPKASISKMKHKNNEDAMSSKLISMTAPTTASSSVLTSSAVPAVAESTANTTGTIITTKPSTTMVVTSSTSSTASSRTADIFKPLE